MAARPTDPLAWLAFGALLASAAYAQAAEAGGGAPFPRLRVSFGVTEYLPLRPSPTKATDYVRNAGRAVPAVVARCGGRSIVYATATDGGATVDFSPSHDVARTRACVIKALPQVTVSPEPASTSVEIPCPTPKAGYVCHISQFKP